MVLIKRPLLVLCAAAALLAGGCATRPRDTASRIVVSIPEQKLVLFRNGELVAEYPVSTSRFGVSDRPGSYGTPLGRMRVARKIGHGQPSGAVFKSRRPTGEILPPNAPGRDPIVTRILWLEGLEDRNRNAFRRFIYIHGTTEEANIGKPVSFGCIRMTSAGVLDLFNRIGVGAEVVVTDQRVSAFARQAARQAAALAHSAPAGLAPAPALVSQPGAPEAAGPVKDASALPRTGGPGRLAFLGSEARRNTQAAGISPTLDTHHASP